MPKKLTKKEQKIKEMKDCVEGNERDISFDYIINNKPSNKIVRFFFREALKCIDEEAKGDNVFR